MQAALAVSGARGASFAAGGRSGPKNLSLTGGDDAEGGASKKEAGAVGKKHQQLRWTGRNKRAASTFFRGPVGSLHSLQGIDLAGGPLPQATSPR